MKTTMKTKLFLSMLTIAIGFTACKKDSPDPVVETVITETVTELDAQADSTFNSGTMGLFHFGPYTKFSFSEGGIVADSAENWDIAFRNSKILVNGGVGEPQDLEQPNRTGDAAAYIIDGEMGDITSVNEDLLMQDGDNQGMYGTTAIIDDQGQAGLGWSIYNPLATPFPMLEAAAGKILVFRTHNNRYAKVEITGFYDAAMTNSYGGFYTFNYVYQSDGTTTF
jgi:hypothetical protein